MIDWPNQSDDHLFLQKKIFNTQEYNQPLDIMESITSETLSQMLKSAPSETTKKNGQGKKKPQGKKQENGSSSKKPSREGMYFSSSSLDENVYITNFSNICGLVFSFHLDGNFNNN